MTDRTPLSQGRKAQEHLLLAVTHLRDAVRLTAPSLTHPIHIQCLASSLVLAQQASLLLAPSLYYLHALPPPPPAPTAPPVLPDETLPDCAKRRQSP